MLEKKAMLGVVKEETGLVIVDKATKKGVRIPDEILVQLTLMVWELCDKLEPKEIVDRLVSAGPMSDDQKRMLSDFVDKSLAFFEEIGWASKAVAAPKASGAAPHPAVHKPAPAVKKK